METQTLQIEGLKHGVGRVLQSGLNLIIRDVKLHKSHPERGKSVIPKAQSVLTAQGCFAAAQM